MHILPECIREGGKYVNQHIHASGSICIAYLVSGVMRSTHLNIKMCYKQNIV